MRVVFVLALLAMTACAADPQPAPAKAEAPQQLIPLDVQQKIVNACGADECVAMPEKLLDKILNELKACRPSI
jgi:hypothetical protein